MGWIKLSFVVSAVFLAASCGAPTKTAADVAPIFDTPAASLQAKVKSLCDKLLARTIEPKLTGVELSLNGCEKAGLVAGNLQDIKEFSFIGLDEEQNDSQSQVIHRSVRTQLWLGRSLLGMATVIGERIRQNKEQGASTGLINLPDSGKTSGIQGLATPKINILEEPKFDLETFSLTTAINFKVSGVIDVDNDVRVSAGLIDNMFALVISSPSKQPYEKSIIQDFSSMVLIVPHATDIYLDLFVNLNLHNPGFGGLIREKITSFLSTGLKSIIDGIFTL